MGNLLIDINWVGLYLCPPATLSFPTKVNMTYPPSLMALVGRYLEDQLPLKATSCQVPCSVGG